MEEALDLLAQADKDAEKDHQRLAELGTLLFAMGRLPEAQDKLCESLRANPEQSHAWIALACIFASMERDNDAERAYHSALHLAPGSPLALAGLGLLYAKTFRFRPAARLLQAAINAGENAAAIHCCLAQAYLFLGDFSKARAAFAAARESDPAQEWILRNHALLCLTETSIEASAEEAATLYQKISGAYSGGLEAACRDAFHLLTGFGQTSAALRLGAFLLARSPDDPVIAYRMDALMGRPHPFAPKDYLICAFDEYAPHFVRHMTNVLHYRLPELCGELLTQSRRTFSHALDLGCGAGLAAGQLSAHAETLTGVDISQAMLEKAAESGLYDFLIRGEATEFLVEAGSSFDLIAALDLFSYFGDLASIVRAAAGRLVRGGLFLFSHNAGSGASYSLLPTGRFAHAVEYVDDITAESFEPVSDMTTPVCLEANMPVAGRVLLLRRK